MVNAVRLITRQEQDLPNRLDPDYEGILPDLEYLEDMWVGMSRWFYDGCLVDRDKAERYLPRFPHENQFIYEHRLAHSTWNDKFKKTIEQDLAGVLSKLSIAELPPSLEEHIENVDLNGNSLEVIIKILDVLALRDGSAFCLIDYPNGAIPQNELQNRRSGNRPYLIPIPRKQVVNWKYNNFSGGLNIEQIVLKRQIKQNIGRFGSEYVEQYLVLEPGQYEIYQSSNNPSQASDFTLVDQGKTGLPFIPIVGYSLHAADPFLADIPLKAIADLNLQLYRLDADLKWSHHLANCPTLVYKEPPPTNDGQKKDRTPDQVKIGAGQVIFTRGDVYWLELEGKTLESTMKMLSLTSEEIDRKSIGYLTGLMGKQKTATEISLNASQAEANLMSKIDQKISALQEIFKIWGFYTNQTAEPTFNYDSSFLTKALQNSDLSAYRESWLTGWLSHKLSLQLASKAGAFPEPLSEEQIDEELQLNIPQNQLIEPPRLPSELDEEGNI